MSSEETKADLLLLATPPATASPTAATAASLLALVRDASDAAILLPRFSTLAAAIATGEVAITKAEVLAAAKAKRGALGGGWTKECALGFKAVLKAFGGAAGVFALAVGEVVVAAKPLVGHLKLSRVLELRQGAGSHLNQLVKVQMLSDDEALVPRSAVRRLRGKAAEIAAAAMEEDVGTVVRIFREAGGDAAAVEACCLGIFNLARNDAESEIFKALPQVRVFG
jgi:hypothetical protein